MQHNTIKLILVTAVVTIMAGCSNYNVRTSDPNSAFCTLGGAALGGGGTALASAGGPVIAGGVMLGALIGNYICSSDGRPVEQAVVTPARTEPQRPVEVARDMDSDNDGVVDRLDRCPNTPAGSRVNANGCPEVLLTLTGVNFAFDSSAIDTNSERVLDRGVQALTEANSVRIHIEGHTDNVGTDEYNQGLSERRANSVRDYLVSKGIAASRLSTDGRGESQPVASNDTADGRYQNRRVELHVEGDSNAR